MTKQSICNTGMQQMVVNVVPLAQWIARWTSNPKVLGSTPRWDENILLKLVDGLVNVGHQFP